MLENKKRIVTGLSLVFGFIVIGITNYYPVIWLTLGAVFLISFYEALKLYKIENEILIVYAVVMWLLTLLFNHPEMLSLLALIVVGSLYAYDAKRYKSEVQIFLYPTVPVFFLLGLYTEYGIEAFFWIIAIVASTDTGAYFSGKAFGKTPFSPVSPKKTIEGVIGGVASGTIVGSIFGMWTISEFVLIIAISLFASISSVFGDLYESYLKRQAGVKDSGDLFPGHGGMLDRVDGYLFAGVVMFAILQGLA